MNFIGCQTGRCCVIWFVRFSVWLSGWSRIVGRSSTDSVIHWSDCFAKNFSSTATRRFERKLIRANTSRIFSENARHRSNIIQAGEVARSFSREQWKLAGKGVAWNAIQTNHVWIYVSAGIRSLVEPKRLLNGQPQCAMRITMMIAYTDKSFFLAKSSANAHCSTLVSSD